MTADELLNKLLETSFTRSDLLRRIGIIKKYMEMKLFKSKDIKIEQFVEEENMADEDGKAVAQWGKELFASLNKENLYKILNEVKEKVKDLKSVTVSLPYQVDSESSEKIGLWFRENAGKKILLDINTDSSLVGGCAVSSGGKWKDYSLRYFMRKNKDKIVDDVINSKREALNPKQ